jgi:acyl dehydratase
MPVDYSALAPGQDISVRTYLLDASFVARYIEAVGDRSRIFSQADDSAAAPPMAVAALSLRGVVEDLAIPGGTLHAGQELEFVRAVQIGETLECRATVRQNSVRGGWRFIVVQMAVEDATGREVMRGKSTLVLPA